MRPTGKLMAMLNPKNCRFDVGTGGMPELTSEDVAGALAFVKPGVGRELLCRVWWPDGAAINSRQLDHTVLSMLLDECSRREEAMYRALGRKACATSAQERYARDEAYEEAMTRRFPGLREPTSPGKANRVSPIARYRAVRTGVLAEISSPRRCTKCAGKQLVRSGGVEKTCIKCGGEGVIAASVAHRARTLGLSPRAYRERWAAPYDWLRSVLDLELQKADRELRAALRESAHAA